jgi:hypothetical protein
MAGPSDTLSSPWIPLDIRPWIFTPDHGIAEFLPLHEINNRFSELVAKKRFRRATSFADLNYDMRCFGMGVWQGVAMDSKIIRARHAPPFYDLQASHP